MNSLLEPTDLETDVYGHLHTMLRQAWKRRVSLRLALKPKDRYANAQQMLADLEAWKPTSKNKSSGKESYSSELSKGALGPLSTPDENSAKKLVEQAMKLARVSGKLIEAADLMEEAFTKSSGLREKYDYFVQLWRQGKVG